MHDHERSDEQRRPHLDALGEANRAFMRATRAIAPARQPVHTVYGGAHLFKAETTRRLGELALRSMARYARDAARVRARRGLRRAATLRAPTPPRCATRSSATRTRCARSAPTPGSRSPSTSACWPSSQREPVEDFRIDFEDGFGARPDAEEDATAGRAAARGGAGPARRARCRPSSASASSRSAKNGKPRGARTLELFVDTLLAATRRTAARQLRRHPAQGHDAPSSRGRWCACFELLERAPRPAGGQRCAWS